MAAIPRFEARDALVDLAMRRIVAAQRFHQSVGLVGGVAGKAQIDQCQADGQCVWMQGVSRFQHRKAIIEATVTRQQFGQAERRLEGLGESALRAPQPRFGAIDPT